MNVTTKLVTIALLIGATTVSAQTLGEFKPKDTKYGLNKAKDAKRIYISNFAINYQVYNEKEDFKQGGSMLGGGHKGDAKAQLSVGLTGLTESDVQQITDKLYQDYLAKIKAKGLEVVSADEASKLESYEDYTRLQGGKASLSQLPGMMSTSPTGYEWFVKKVNKDGKAKSGGFLNNPASMYPKLSKDLNNAIIATVDMYVMFIQDQDAFRGAGANIKVKTNLRLAGQEAIVMTSDAKFKMKGQNEIVPISSGVSFYHGKMGMGATTSYVGTLSKGMWIGDVIEDTKLQSFAKNDADAMGTKIGMYRMFNPDNMESKSTKIIEVDSKKYTDGVYSATKKFLEHHTQDFLNGL